MPADTPDIRTTDADTPTVSTGSVAVKPLSQRHRSFLSRLTTGTGAFDVLGHRRQYYTVSLVLVLISLILLFTRGFNFGIDFEGGTRITVPSSAGVTAASVSQVLDGANIGDVTVQTVGTGGSATIQARTATLTTDQVIAAKQSLITSFGLSTDQVSSSDVSETWGGEISRQAIIALIVFLVAVAAFLWIRYERRVAIGAVVSVFHDLIITAGIYSLIGFEVTPATVIGLLAILGFSLYDTVVVYDKVQENTKGLTSLLRRTYREAANLAINQTLMRSINTTVIALLPVGGLLVAGVAILGSGTLKDLALVQLVGMIVSGYSSVFIAVPVAVDLRTRDAVIKAHTARVVARRKADGLLVDADGDPIGHTAEARARARTAVQAVGSTASSTAVGGGVTTAPRPGVKPQRPSGNPAARPAGKATRPTGKRPR